MSTDEKPPVEEMSAAGLAALFRGIVAAYQWTNPETPEPSGEIGFRGMMNIIRRVADGTGFVVHRKYLLRAAELLEQMESQ